MATVTEPAVRDPEPSPAGPADPGDSIRMPPAIRLGMLRQTFRFGTRPLAFSIAAHNRYGDVWQVKLMSRRDPIAVTSHPDHAKSLFTAKPPDAPSLTGESPLRPVLGPDSVLTAVGDRHMRQRKLLLPAFHGEAVERYAGTIAEVAEREIDRWQLGREFALAPRMQAVTLDVIMAGIFGIGTRPEHGTPEYKLRQTLRTLMRTTTHPLWQLVELQNLRSSEPRGLMRAGLKLLDQHLYASIQNRRKSDARGDDVLSLLLDARDDAGRPLTDRELRNELMALVLAGHETTANSLAWTIERLLRAPAAYDRLREEARSAGDEYVEATVDEGMRVRPVIPMVIRMVNRPWRLGDYVVPAGTPVAVSIAALHHRDDVYPDPYAFRPERFVGRSPGTYTWIPFGGGIRRCLGATLALAEQRIVLGAIARRTDLDAPRRKPEKPRQRNVTMIPSRGGRVVVRAKRPA